MELKDRMQAVLDESGLTKAELAHAIGLTTGAISHYFSGHTKSVRAVTASNIERATGISATWLATGQGAMMASDRPKPPPTAAPAPLGEVKVPVISHAQVLALSKRADPYSIGEIKDWLRSPMDLSSRAFALEIIDESMRPAFHKGDHIIADPLTKPLPGDYVVAIVNGSIVVRRYRPRGPGADPRREPFELVPLNDDYPSLHSESADIEIIGVQMERREYRRR